MNQYLIDHTPLLQNSQNRLSVFSTNLGLPRKSKQIHFGHRIGSPRFGIDEDTTSQVMSPIVSPEDKNESDATMSVHNLIRDRLNELHNGNEMKYWNNQESANKTWNRGNDTKANSIIRTAEQIYIKGDDEMIWSSGAASTSAETNMIDDDVGNSIEEIGESIMENPNLTSELRAIRSMVSTIMRVTTNAMEEKPETTQEETTSEAGRNETTSVETVTDGNSYDEERISEVVKRKPQPPPEKKSTTSENSEMEACSEEGEKSLDEESEAEEPKVVKKPTVVSLNGRKFQLIPIEQRKPRFNNMEIERLRVRKEVKLAIENMRELEESKIEQSNEIWRKKEEDYKNLLEEQEKHLRSAHRAVDTLEAERRRSAVELAAIERLFKDSAEQLREATETKNEIEATQGRTAAELDKVKFQLNRTEEELDEAKTEITNLITHNLKLEAEIKSVQAQIPDISLLDEKEQLLGTLRSHRLQYEMLHHDMNETRQQLKEAQSLNEDREKELAKLKNTVEEMENSQMLLKAQLDAVQSRKAELSQQLAQRKEVAITELIEKRNTARNLKNAEETIRQLRDELEKVQEELAENKSDAASEVRKLEFKVEKLKNSNQILTFDLEETLHASQTLYRQVEEIRATGKILSHEEYLKYEAKNLSNNRRRIESVQRLSLKNKKLSESKGIQVGMKGRLVWDVPLNDAEKNEINDELSQNVKELESASNKDDIEKNWRRAAKSKYRADGRLIRKQFLARDEIKKQTLEEEKLQSQKPTHTFHMRRMESKAMIDAIERREETRQSRPMRTVFRLNRQTGTNHRAVDKETKQKPRLDLPKPPVDLILNSPNQKWKSVEDLKQDIDEYREEIRGTTNRRQLIEPSKDDWFITLEAKDSQVIEEKIEGISNKESNNQDIIKKNILEDKSTSAGTSTTQSSSLSSLFQGRIEDSRHQDLFCLTTEKADSNPLDTPHFGIRTSNHLESSNSRHGGQPKCDKEKMELESLRQQLIGFGVLAL